MAKLTSTDRQNNTQQLHVAVGIVFNQHREVLIAKRDPKKHLAELWEFPGGKLEANENAYQALCREYVEEIGIEITEASPLLMVEYSYDDRDILLDVWLVSAYTGTPYGAEGQLIRWVPIADLSQYPFPSGNAQIIAKLKATAA